MEAATFIQVMCQVAHRGLAKESIKGGVMKADYIFKQAWRLRYTNEVFLTPLQLDQEWRKN